MPYPPPPTQYYTQLIFSMSGQSYAATGDFYSQTHEGYQGMGQFVSQSGDHYSVPTEFLPLAGPSYSRTPASEDDPEDYAEHDLEEEEREDERVEEATRVASSSQRQRTRTSNDKYASKMTEGVDGGPSYRLQHLP